MPSTYLQEGQTDFVKIREASGPQAIEYNIFLPSTPYSEKGHNNFVILTLEVEVGQHLQHTCSFDMHVVSADL